MVANTVPGDRVAHHPSRPRLQLRWLGVAGLELRAGDQTLLIDPFLSRPGLWDTVRGRLQPDGDLLAATLGPVDQVLVTHAHWDHLLDTPEILRQTGAVAYGSPNTCRLLAACGLPPGQIRQIGAGERLQLNHFQVEVLPARHMPLPGFGSGPLPAPPSPPRRARDYRMDTCFSFHITAQGLSLLDWTSQDAERPPGRPPPRADLLLVKLVGSGHYYRKLMAAVQPRLVVPLHWDNPFRPLREPAQALAPRSRWMGPLQRLVDPRRFEPWLEVLAPGVEVLVPEAGHAYDLGALLAGGRPG